MKDADKESVVRYVKAAEEQYRNIPDPEYLLVRPLINFVFTPIYYYRVGVLFSALEAGFHDVLEFGAGTCWLGSILYRLGSRVTFMEVSETALKLGKKHMAGMKPVQRFNSPPNFVLYDGFTFPLKDASMDRIVCHDAFHHIPNPRRVLEEMFRVLKPGGKIAFAEPGEGHSQSLASKEDMNEDGVLEADVSFDWVTQTAKEIGFDGIYFKPFPKIETLTLTSEQYSAFQKGDNSIIPQDEMRKDLKYFLTIVLTKGDQTPDTRYPKDTRAAIELIGKSAAKNGPPSGEYEIRLKNVGNTTWLSPYVKTQAGRILKDNAGGYVWIWVQLKDENGKMIDPRYYIHPIPENIGSGKQIDISLTVPLPKEKGKYIFEFDLNARGHFLFADHHLNAHTSESLQVPVEI